ncbi:MAG: BCCT family transporter [Clostridiales Family XIII bacterium]|jgi:choline-glycine betaine transporter|nr:BCCT family transporter [Clostridiales Family XIII bacterium]
MDNINQEKASTVKKVDLTLKKGVFFIPWSLLILMVVLSFVNKDGFLGGLNAVTGWILGNFAWLFNSVTILCVATVIIVYFSPLGKVRIGGKKAKPIVSYGNLVWITLCIDLGAGILFWAAAEPMYHMFAPAAMTGAAPGSPEAATFAMETMFLEWTWSPMAIYTVAGILFAFVFHNMKEQASLGSGLVPVFGPKVRKYKSVVDVVCLFAVAAGMAASLGTGAMTIAGGLENIAGIQSGPVSWAIVIAVIVVTFIISSVSGVDKGIKILSNINSKAYFILLAFVIIFGPTAFMANFTFESIGAYLSDFFKMSFATGDIYNDGWAKGWPIFYWCNWLAWTPVTGVFIGHILKGYTIKQGITCNFVIPALFSTLWMGLFATASIYYENAGMGFHDMLLDKGPESIIYAIFDQFPLAIVVIPFYLFLIFISFVTAADSNTTAMAGLCTSGNASGDVAAPTYLKVVWGVTIGAVTWVLISLADIEGVKAASNLGGFPNMFLVGLFAVGLLKICRNPKKYDVHKEDYEEGSHGQYKVDYDDDADVS